MNDLSVKINDETVLCAPGKGEHKVRPYIPPVTTSNGKCDFPNGRGKACIRPKNIAQYLFSAGFSLAIILSLLTGLLSLPINAQEDSILVDKIAAVVNQEIITLNDIDKAIQFYPLFRKTGETEDQFYDSVLEDLINYKVVYLEFSNDFQLKEEDFVQVQMDAIERVGDLDEFKRRLESFDMEWDDFKVLVREKVIYDKVLENRLQVRIGIGFKEIETFYNEEYLPIQKQMGLKPRSLVQMTSQIENHLKLRKIRTRQRLADWLKKVRASYRIENKRKQEKAQENSSETILNKEK